MLVFQTNPVGVELDSNSLPLPSLTFYGPSPTPPPPRASRGSAIHVFLVSNVNAFFCRNKFGMYKFSAISVTESS